MMKMMVPIEGPPSDSRGCDVAGNSTFSSVTPRPLAASQSRGLRRTGALDPDAARDPGSDLISRQMQSNRAPAGAVNPRLSKNIAAKQKFSSAFAWLSE